MRGGLPLLLVPLLLAGGCHTTCKQACRVLLDCEEVESSRVGLSECEDSCEREKSLYEDWDDTQLQRALRDELDCIGSSSCEEIAAGACFDPRLYLYGDTGGP